MKKVTVVTREFANKLGAELEAAMQKVAAKYGMAVGGRKGAFGPTSLKTSWTISVTEVTKTGNVIDQAGRQFQQYAKLFGLNPNMLFGTFTNRGRTIQIIGLDTKKRAFPIICKDVDSGKVSFFRATGLAAIKIKLAK